MQEGRYCGASGAGASDTVTAAGSHWTRLGQDWSGEERGLEWRGSGAGAGVDGQDWSGGEQDWSRWEWHESAT